MTPTHGGVGALAASQNPACNLAYTQKVTASSSYTDTARNFTFSPKYAVDDNNATQWKAGDSFMGHWLQVDLGTVEPIARTMVQFEYSIYYYQYLIQTSVDGVAWSTFADRTANKIPGSPMVDAANVSARYVRLVITGVQKPGMYAAVWNFKVFPTTSAFNPPQNAAATEGPAPTRGQLLISVDASCPRAPLRVDRVVQDVRRGARRRGRHRPEERHRTDPPHAAPAALMKEARTAGTP